MNILNSLTIKHLKMNKRRTIVSIIGIMLSTALLVGIGLIASSIREYAIYEAIRYDGRYHSKINKFPKEKLNELKNNKEIEKYFYQYSSDLTKDQRLDDDDWNAYFHIINSDRGLLEELVLLEGELPKNNREILVSENLIRYSTVSYKIGDNLELSYGEKQEVTKEREDGYGFETVDEFTPSGKKETYKITGIVENNIYGRSDREEVYTLDESTSVDTVNVYIIFNKLKNVQKKTEKIFDDLDLKTSYKSKIEVSEKDQKNSRIDYNSSLLILHGESNNTNLMTVMSSYLTIILSVISVACIIVIYNAFSISVMERKKQFGLLSSIGATKKQIKKTVVFETLIVGTIGIITGILAAYLGIWIVSLVINNLLKDMLERPFVLATYPMFVIIPIILTIIAIRISAMLPVKRASKMSALEVIRQTDDIKIKSKKLKTPKIIIKLFGMDASIAYKNMKRNKKKYRITIISIFISIVAFLTFSSFLTYGVTSFSNFLGEIDFDISMTYHRYEEYENTAKESKELMDSILEHSQVDDYIKFDSHYLQSKIINESFHHPEYVDFYKDRIDPSYKTINDDVSIVVLEDKDYEAYKKEIGLKEDRPILINTGKIEDYGDDGMSRNIIEVTKYKKDSKLKYELCDMLDFYSQHYNEEKGTYTYTDEEVIAHFEKNCYANMDNFFLTDKEPKMFKNTYTFGLIIVNQKMMNEIINSTTNKELFEDYSTSAYIKAKKYNELDKLAESIEKNALQNLYYENISAEMTKVNNAMLAIRILFYGLVGLVTLIGITSVFNTVTTSMELRRKEFAILRSVGLSPKGFNKMIWFESILFGVKALLYGLPVGIGLSYLVNQSSFSLVESDFFIDYKSVIISIIGVFVIILITMWYSTAKINKNNILDTIRDENI